MTEFKARVAAFAFGVAYPEAFISGAAADRAKTMVTRVPCPGANSTSRPALAFSRNDLTIRAPSLPRLGHSAPSGRPTPSSATTTDSLCHRQGCAR